MCMYMYHVSSAQVYFYFFLMLLAFPLIILHIVLFSSLITLLSLLFYFRLSLLFSPLLSTTTLHFYFPFRFPSILHFFTYHFSLSSFPSLLLLITSSLHSFSPASHHFISSLLSSTTLLITSLLAPFLLCSISSLHHSIPSHHPLIFSSPLF